jgi:murein L,D-transpeptidase YafK
LVAFLTFAFGLAAGSLGSLLAGRSALAGSPALAVPAKLSNPRLVVVKHKRMLHLFDGESLIKTYRIGLGQRPVGDKIRRNDDRTPLGTFYICCRNRASRYHRFLGISYPNERAVRRGLAEGWISMGQAEAIRAALREGRQPDGGTSLGGGIGLHGGGNDRDWTAGCIALTNEMIEELDAVLDLGDPVEILP